ncbi:MAG: hypothetical protein RJB22_580 [Pseudomonadota bacterium]|jgi:DNA-binding MarR family transcriptional regulator
MQNDKLLDHFGRIHAEAVAALSQHLITCRRHFDGDLDLLLVLMIVGERTFAPKNAGDISFRDWAHTDVRSVKPEAINLQSIADYSGIPRETVRRKLDILARRGWIERDGRKFITVTEKAREDLADLTHSNLRYLIKIQNALADALGASPDAQSQPSHLYKGPPAA